MTRITGGLISGVAIGIIIGTGLTISATDSKQRRQMIRDSKRAVRRAGHFVHDIFD